MISFILKEDTQEAAFEVLKRFQLFSLAESLGGVESLVGHPASMTHSTYSREEREAHGISEGLVRISVGLEQIEDILEDLHQALGTNESAAA